MCVVLCDCSWGALRNSLRGGVVPCFQMRLVHIDLQVSECVLSCVFGCVDMQEHTYYVVNVDVCR